MIKRDEAIESIRDVRKQISRSLGNDPKRLLDYYRKLQARHEDRVVESCQSPNQEIQKESPSARP